MFAMDGPIASISEPAGVCLPIHVPAARPPGTPPVPARNVVEDAAVPMLPKDAKTSHAATAAVAPMLIAGSRISLPRASLSGSWRSTSIEARSEEHTSELQSRPHLVCRLLLE